MADENLIRVSELSGEWLDYWVAKAEDHEVDPPLAPGQPWPNRETLGRKYEPNYIRFSSDWAAGGPIIERDRINLHATQLEDWRAWVDPNGRIDRGDTALIAAMRAKVASHFGETVPAL